VVFIGKQKNVERKANTNITKSMNKTEIDKTFKEKILQHEKSSGVYKPEHWNNFEKQLDKLMPVAKKSNFFFSLNNIFLVLSVLTFIAVIPILLLHSSEINKSSLLPQTICLVDRNIKPDFKPISIATDNNNISHQNSFNTTTIQSNNINGLKKNATIMPENIKQSEALNEKQKESDNQIAAINAGNIAIADNKISVKKDMRNLNTVIPQKDSSSAEKFNLAKDSGNKTPATDKGKHGKKKRKNILIPFLNYNGF
jgi:hypothetical protein